MAIQGSIEIIRGNVSVGVVGSEWVPEEVPIVLRNLHGIQHMQEAEPTQQPTGRTPEYQWTGTDANNQEALIFLWEEIPFEETYAAMIGPEPAEG